MLSFFILDSRVSESFRIFQEPLELNLHSNSGLYVSSRTLFVLAQRSEYDFIKRTLGRTNNGHTPLAAIFVSFLPGLLAFLAVKSSDITFQEVSIHRYASKTQGRVVLTSTLADTRLRAPLHRYDQPA